MTLLEVLQQRRDEIVRIAAKHGAYNIRVFGSIARGEARSDSDIDLLIEKGPITSPWFPAGLVLELEDILGQRIDIVTETALNPYLRDHVLREAVSL